MIKKELIVHSDHRGRLFEVLRSDDLGFIHFGQIYTSLTKPGIVRSLHKHLQHTDYICCIQGEIKVVLIDEETKYIDEIILSGKIPTTIIISPGTYHGWKTISEVDALTISITTKTFDKNNIDAIYIDSSFLNYDWK